MSKDHGYEVYDLGTVIDELVSVVSDAMGTDYCIFCQEGVDNAKDHILYHIKQSIYNDYA